MTSRLQMSPPRVKAKDVVGGLWVSRGWVVGEKKTVLEAVAVAPLLTIDNNDFHEIGLHISL